MSVNQCAVQVTGRLKTREELAGWDKWLQKKGFQTQIREYNVKNNSKSFALFRSMKDGECNIPSEGYWKFIRGTFWKAERTPQKITDSICPRCGTKHKDTKGDRTFCKNCISISRKSGEGFSCESNRKPKGRAAHK